MAARSQLRVRRKERTLVATTTERRIHYLHAGAERLRFTDEVFDLVFATMSMRHWTDQAGGIAGIDRVLTLHSVTWLPRLGHRPPIGQSG
jgi:ubiquinone/menaquinone biosynthesis C-methylase UbiE